MKLNLPWLSLTLLAAFLHTLSWALQCGDNDFVARFELQYINKFTNKDIQALWTSYKASDPVQVTNKLDYGICLDAFSTQTKTCCPADFLSKFQTILKAYWLNRADNVTVKPVCAQTLKQLGQKIKTCGQQKNTPELADDLTAGGTPTPSVTSSSSSAAAAATNSSTTATNSSTASTPSTTTNSTAATSTATSTTTTSATASNTTTSTTNSSTTTTTSSAATSTNSSSSATPSSSNSSSSSTDNTTYINSFYQIKMKNNVAQGLLVQETMSYLRGVLCLLCQDPGAATADKQKLYQNDRIQLNKASLSTFTSQKQSALLLLQKNHNECWLQANQTLSENLDATNCPKLQSSIDSLFRNHDPCPENDNCTTAANSFTQTYESPIDTFLLVTDDEITSLGNKRMRMLQTNTSSAASAASDSTTSTSTAGFDVSDTAGLSAYTAPKDASETSDLSLDGVAFDPIMNMATTVISEDQLQTNNTNSTPVFTGIVILDSEGNIVTVFSQIISAAIVFISAYLLY